MKARKTLGTRTLGTISILLIASVTLAGCLDEKRNRITKFEPGVYKGRMDTKLTAAQKSALARRTVHQSGVTQVTGGGSRPASTSSSVRMPSDSAVFYGKLNSRAANQKGP